MAVLALPRCWSDKTGGCIRFGDTKNGAQIRPITASSFAVLKNCRNQPNGYFQQCAAADISLACRKCWIIFVAVQNWKAWHFMCCAAALPQPLPWWVFLNRSWPNCSAILFPVLQTVMHILSILAGNGCQPSFCKDRAVLCRWRLIFLWCYMGYKCYNTENKGLFP